MKKITLVLIKENGLIAYALLMVFIVGITLSVVITVVERLFIVQIPPSGEGIIAGLVGVPVLALLLRRKINQLKSQND